MPPAMRTRCTTTVVPLPPTGGGTGTRWAVLQPVCHVFLFPAAAAAAQQQVPLSDVIRALSFSLAAVLPAFHTLAGELVYSTELGTVTIVCGEDAGVAFVQAETDLDLASLVAVEDGGGATDLDVDAFPQLVPDICREELPAPMFAVQVTEFDGGMALGVALNHVATDGIGFFRFMQMWAASSAMAAGATSTGSTWTEPLHDRRLVRFDGDEELARRLLRQAAPDLPRVSYYCYLSVATNSEQNRAKTEAKQRN